jgi:hypothetical protein
MTQLSFFILSLMASIYLNAQTIPEADCYQYTEEHSEKIAIANEVNLNTLNIIDKLKFKEKTLRQNYNVYFNLNGHQTVDAYFVSHENMFPKWYTPPLMIRTDEDGIKSYFSGNNPIMKDGWTGGLIS